MAELKLYAFKPQGHGEYSAFIVAESEQEARKLIVEKYDMPEPIEWGLKYFDTDFYDVTVVDFKVPVFNCND